MTVAGILIPLSILTIGLSTQTEGLCVLFVAAAGLHAELLAKPTVGWAFGLQLIFLGVGVLRLVWGMPALVNALF